MKNILIYIGGIITGIILTFLISFLLIHNNENTSTETEFGITMFDEPGDSMEVERFEVFQVLGNGRALAHCEKNEHGRSNFYGPIVLLINDEGEYYYDEEIVKVPQGGVARKVGVYRYETNMGYKTVPVVKIIK